MMERYGSQICLPEIGSVGQRKLDQAKVLVVGAGGLGSVLLPVLTGAGVGEIHIMDDDVVEEGNLHRQTLYRMADIGRNKAEAAALHLHGLNPHTSLISHEMGAQEDMVMPLLKRLMSQTGAGGKPIVLDAADNFATTYMLSDLCKALELPFISASAIRWSGYAGIFCGTVPSYRAVFPNMSQSGQNCQTAGILGPVVGLVGMLQAQLCLSLLLGLQPSPAGRLYRWDARALRMSSFSFCDAEEPARVWPFLSVGQLQEQDLVIDVRIPGEKPSLSRDGVHNLPLDQFSRLTAGHFPQEKRLVLCCQTGLRAARAAAMLEGQGYNNLALMALKHQRNLT